jgi:hypothetical protein
MSITNALASIAVRDIGNSIRWYRGLLGRNADLAPVPQVAEWQFEQGGSLQIYELTERAGGSSATLCVSSVEDQIANLRKIGIDPGSPMIAGDEKILMIKDPHGNSIAFVERGAAR